MWASALPSTALVLERNSAKIFPYRAKQSVFLGLRNQEELNQSYYGYVLLNKRKTNLYQYFTGGIQNIIIMSSMFWSLGLLRWKLEFFAGGGVMFCFTESHHLQLYYRCSSVKNVLSTLAGQKQSESCSGLFFFFSPPNSHSIYVSSHKIACVCVYAIYTC